MSNLSRLVWRFDAGLASALELRAEFSDEISVLLERSLEARSRPTWIMQAEAVRACTTVFDRALDQARRTVTAGSFADGLRYLEEAGASLRRMEQAKSAQIQIENAARERDHLTFIAGLGPNLKSSCLLIIDRLIEKSEKIFRTGEFRQSRFIARMSHHETTRLSTAAADNPAVANALHDQLLVLRRVKAKCGVLGRKMGDGEIEVALVRIEELIDDRYYVLSERLMDDLQFQMAGQFGFVAEVERQFGPISAGGADGVSTELAKVGLGSSLSLEAGTQWLLELSLERVGGAAKALPSPREPAAASAVA
jgi:hypothetical protein